MATYQAALIHAERAGEGLYEFEAEPGLVAISAMKTLRAFVERVETMDHLDLAEWHVTAVHRDTDKGVVTGMGIFVFGCGDEQPFVCFITETS